MKIKATFSFAYDESGSLFWPSIGQSVPITEKMAARFQEGSASGAVADYASGCDVAGFTSATLVSKGDAYTCARWELS